MTLRRILKYVCAEHPNQRPTALKSEKSALRVRTSGQILRTPEPQVRMPGLTSTNAGTKCCVVGTKSLNAGTSSSNAGTPKYEPRNKMLHCRETMLRRLQKNCGADRIKWHSQRKNTQLWHGFCTCFVGNNHCCHQRNNNCRRCNNNCHRRNTTR